jgi:prepilin-type processing-associated H-X9-DG protein
MTNNNYAVCGGSGTTYGARPNGAPTTFTPQPGMFNGLNRIQKIKLTNVTDGLTNTIMIGEVRQGQNSDLRGFIWWGDATAMSTFAPPNTSSPDQIYTAGYCNNQATQGMPCTGTGGATFYSRSRHPGGVNVCLGDGSVRFISDSVSPTVWLLMGPIDDGQVITIP